MVKSYLKNFMLSNVSLNKNSSKIIRLLFNVQSAFTSPASTCAQANSALEKSPANLRYMIILFYHYVVPPYCSVAIPETLLHIL